VEKNLYKKSFTYDGKRYWVYAHDKNNLPEKITLKKKELEDNAIKETNISVANWAAAFMEIYKEPFIEYKSLEMYNLIIKKINSYIGNKAIRKVISSDLQKIINKEYQEGKSKSYIDKLYITIKQIFKRAKIDKKIADDPSEGLIRPKMQIKTRRALTDEERSVLLEVAKTNPHGDWALCMLYLGLRPSETALIEKKDVDIDKSLLHVRGTKTASADRYVPIPSHMLDIFIKDNNSRYIFPNRDGVKSTEQSRRNWWKNIKRDMNILMGAKIYRNQLMENLLSDDLTMYCLRHTYGTDLQSAGVPINVAREFMGHSDISITSKYYTHSSDISTQNALKSLDDFYRQCDTNRDM